MTLQESQILSKKNKRALLLCASHNDLGLIRALRSLDYYIIATGNNAKAPGNRLVDEWVCEDYSDKSKILEIAKLKRIDVVCQCCNDYGVYTAAYIAEKMGLPGYDDYNTTLILHNKDRFKKFARENNILTPKTYSFTEKSEAIDYINKTKMKLIVKPVDASAGNGIGIIKNSEDYNLERIVDEAFNFSKSKRIVIEEYIDGKQYGFCTYLHNKKVIAIASNNEYSIINPFRVEIDTFPSDNFEECKKFLVDEIELIAEKLNLVDGIFHVQYILHNGKPWIIEVMRRILGNMYSVISNKLNSFDWDYWEIRSKCGLECSSIPYDCYQNGFYAYKAIMSTKDGCIEDINIPKEYIPYIFKKFWLKKRGDIVDDYLKQPIGFLFFKFPNMQEMNRVLIDNYRNDLVVIRG